MDGPAFGLLVRLRSGARGAGEPREAPWDPALGAAATRLLTIRDRPASEPVWAWPLCSLPVLARAALPLAMAAIEVLTHRVRGSVAPAPSVLVPAGGLAHRLVLVYAGPQGL